VSGWIDPGVIEVEQRQDARLARPVSEAFVKPKELLARVAAGGRDEADPGDRLAGQREHVAVERRAALRHREPTAAHGEDPPTL
jgi:hypothetical protein